MKKFAVLCALFSAVLTPHARAQDECSNGSMRGQYSFVAAGTFGGAPFAAAGYGIYDGHGNVQGVIQTSLNGNANPGRRLDRDSRCEVNDHGRGSDGLRG